MKCELHLFRANRRWRELFRCNMFSCLMVCRWWMRHGVRRRRIKARVGDLWPEDRWVEAQAGGSVAGRSGSHVTPCAIRIVLVEETRNTGFAVWPQNRLLRFGGLGLKTTATVVGLGLKTKERGGLSVCASKPTGGGRRCGNTRLHWAACFGAK